MFRTEKITPVTIIGIIFFVAMFPLNLVLPKWTGVENGIIENTQMLWLAAGLIYCGRMIDKKQPNWGGSQKHLWYAGIIFFFLVIMREISWGRALFLDAQGKPMEYSQMGLYGKLVHPMVVALIASLLYCCYRAKAWLFIRFVKLPTLLTGELFLFVFVQWFAEHKKFKFFAGDVAEELTEFGAYMLLYFILKNMCKELEKKNK